MTESSRFEPWKTLVLYAEAGEHSELEAFVVAIGSSETFRSLLRLEPAQRELVLTTLSPTEAAEIMEEIPGEHAADFIEQLSPSDAASIVDAMESAEQADLLSDMSEVEAEAILARMDPQRAADARELIRYARDEAGSLMVTEFLAYPETALVRDVLDGLSDWVAAQPDEEAHVYVVSATGILIGGLDLRGLVLTRRTTPLSEVVKPPRFVSVTATLDELDNLFECHQLSSVAVVNSHQKLLGVLRRDDLSRALQERADADYLKSQGIVSGDEIRAMPVLTRARRRLSWLRRPPAGRRSKRAPCTMLDDTGNPNIPGRVGACRVRPNDTPTPGENRMDRSRRAVLAVLTVAACALPQALHAGGKDPLAAFVVLGQTDTGAQFALARVVIDRAGADCPSLEPAGCRSEKQVMTPRDNPDKDNFDVTVCEAPYPTDGSRMDVHGTFLTLPAVPATVSRVTVFGDTGCKPNDQKDCKKDEDWPFGEMADAAAKADPAPDLVLHMGDYNYRGTPGSIKIKQADGKTEKVRIYDAGDNTPSVTCTLSGPYYGQNSVGSETPDSWKAWKHDFFEPAAKLLIAAPWVFARGNHELCSRAGPGFFYLLDPGSALVQGSGGQQTCPPAEAKMPLIFRQPYRVDLGGLSVVVLDSANACDQGTLHQKHFNVQFEQIQSLVKGAPAANAIWLESHRPLWGLKKPDADTLKTDLDASGQYAISDKTLQTAFATYPLPKPVHLVLSGHMHRFQTIGFDPPGVLPNQLIVGNGGIALAHNYPPDAFSVDIDDATAVGFGLSEFGYMDIVLTGGGEWTGRLLDRKGNLLAQCDSSQPSKTGACAPAGR